MKKIVSIFVTMLMCVLTMNLSAQTLADYTFTTGTDASRWITLTSPTQIYGAGYDDYASSLYNIGFTFQLAGVDYTQFSVNTNGNFKLGSTATSSSYYSSPFGASNSTYNYPKIVGVSRDLGTCTGGYIRYQLTGTAPNRVLVCEFKTGYTYTSSLTADVNWEIQLFEGSNDVQIVYSSTAPSSTPSSYQCGIEASPSDLWVINPTSHTISYGTSSSTYSTWPGVNRYYRFSAPAQNSVNNLTVSDVTLSSAVATWNENSDATGYTVYCNGVNQTVTLPTALLTGLSAGTTYTVSVTPLGIAGAEAATETFTTNELQAGCVSYGAEESVELSSSSLGASASTWYSAPINNYFNYSYTQQIFTPSELGGAGTIKSVSFKYNYSSSMSASNVRLYLAHRSSSTFSGTSDFTPFSDAVLVYTGSLNCSQGWNTFTLNTPFEYNGVDNLVLIAFDNVSGFSGSAYTFNTHNTGANRALYYYSDSSIPDPNNLGSYSGSQSTSMYRNDVKFGIQPCNEYRTITCYSPIASITQQGETDYTISWAPGYDETQWDVYLTTSADAPTASTTPTATGVTSRSMHFENLMGLTTYYAYVRSNCGDETSAWVAAPAFTTGCGEYVTVPYTAQFTADFPQCWSSLLYESASSSNAVEPYTSTYSSAPASLRFYSATAGYYAMAITPQMDPSVDMKDLLVRFKMYAGITSQALVVGVMTDPTDFSTFTPVESVYVTSTYTWQDKEVNFSSYTGDGHYVAFYFVNGTSTYAYIDNLVVTYAPVPATLPYVTGFEDAVDNANWIINNGSYTNQWAIGNATNNGGSNALYISNDGGVSNNYNTSSSSYVWAYRDVVFTPSAYGYKLSFDWKGYGESSFDYMLVYFGNPSVPSGSSAPSGVTQLNGAGGYSSNYFNYTSSWKHYEYEFPSYDEETTVRFYFYWRNDGSGGATPPAAVDNFSVERITCRIPEIADIHVTGLTLSEDVASAHLSWTSFEETGWDIYLTTDPTYVPNAATTPSYNTTVPSFDLTNLDGSTTYYVYIRPYCDGTAMGWSAIRKFNTPCPPVTVPYFEGFEDVTADNQYNSYPTCWQRDASETFPYVSSTTPATGNNALYCHSSETESYFANSQAIDVSAYNPGELAVYFKARVPIETSGRFDLGVMTDLDDPTTFTNLLSVYPTDFPAVDNYIERVVLLQAAYTEPIYLVFKMPSGATNNFYLDDVEVREAPTCGDQNNLQVSNVSATSALLTFNTPDFGVNECWIGYKSDADADWTMIFVRDASEYFLQGLEPQTNYNVKLVPSCNETQVLTTNFTTLCPAYDYTSTGSGTRSTEIGDATTTASTFYFMPGWYGWHYEAFLYRLSENEGANGLLKSLAFNVQQGNASTGSTLQIFVKEVPNTFSMSASNTFNQLVEGAQSIYNGSGDYSTTGWKTFTLDNDFTVNSGNNLLVLFKGTGCGTSGGCTKYLYYTSTPNSYWYKHKDSSDPGQNVSGDMSESYLPNMRFEFAQYACADITGVCLAPNVVVSDITNSSANVTWAAGNEESAWQVSYKYADSYVWSAPAGLTTQSFPLTGLTSGSAYQVRVRAYCGDDQYSDWTVVDFETLCEDITVPYMQNFEDSWGSGSEYFVTCWQRGYNTPTANPYVDDVYSYNGNYSLFLNNYNDNLYAYAALPRMEDGVVMNNLDVRFWAHAYSVFFQMEVGVMTDPNDFSTFVPIGAVSPSSANTWEPLSVKTTGYTGNGRYIAFRIPAWHQSSMHIDDLVIDYITECEDVTAVSVSNITETSVDVSWTAPAGQDEWEVIVAPAGQIDFTVTPVLVNGTPNVTINGLTGDRQYDVVVRANCSADEHSFWTMPVTFRTDCPQYMTLPYTENFDDYTTDNTNSFPDCWTRTNIVSTYLPRITSTYMSTPRGSLYMPNYSSYNTIAIAPEVDPTIPMSSLYASFKLLKPSATYPNAVIIGFMTDNDDPSTFVAIDTVSPKLVASWEKFEFFFDEFDNLPDGSFIALKSISTNASSSYNYVYVDDFYVDYAPNCRRPKGIDVTQVTASSALLTFDQFGTPESWNVEYGPTGFERGTGVMVTATSNPFRIYGLNEQTLYDVYAQASCGGGEVSMWSDPAVQFFTPCTPYSLPFTEDFTGLTAADAATVGTLPDCWNDIYTGLNPNFAPKVCNADAYLPGTESPYLYIEAGYSSDYGDNNIAIMPLIDDMGAVKVAFNAVADNLNSTLDFGYMDGNNFISLQTVPVGTTPELFSYVFCGKVYPLGARFAFQLHYTNTAANTITHVGIDNIEITNENIEAMDYDHNFYTVKVYGHQCWLTENLRSEHYSDGVEIPNATPLNDDPTTIPTYGLFYDWNAAARVPQGSTDAVFDAQGHVQGVCPEGWRLPTVADYQLLLQNVNGVADLKSSADSQYWLGQYGGNNPGSGFNAIPAGYEQIQNFYNLFGEAYFWTVTNVTAGVNKALCLPYYCPEMIFKDMEAHTGLNVRCVISD